MPDPTASAGRRLLPPPWRWTGLVPATLGAALVLGAAGLFARRATTIKPFEESTTLVADGPFRLTRNPMYLGMVAILAGAALGFGSLTPWLAPPLLAWLLTARFIVHEERMLLRRFGPSYREYCRRVPRWLLG